MNVQTEIVAPKQRWNPHASAAPKERLPYDEFLRSKVKLAQSMGLPCEAVDCNPILKDHQSAIARWMVEGGRRACFAAFGLGKSVIQLEVIRMILAAQGGRGLIVIPLGVRQEFRRDAVELLGWSEPPKFIRRIEEAGPTGIYMTNYETIRDGKLDPAEFIAVSLDEAACLRSFGGSATFRQLMRLCTGDGGPCGNHRTDGKSVKYRFVATATPSPNDYIELLSYSEYLGIMDVSGAKTRFFKRDSTKADVLTLHPHKIKEFFLWLSSWAIFVQKPSDIDPSFSDEGYIMPPMEIHWHEVPSDHKTAGFDKSGQGKLLRDSTIGVGDAAAEKRSSLAARIEKLLEIRAIDPLAHRVIWHDLEDERRAIEKAIPTVKSVTGNGTQKLDAREALIIDFSDGKFQELSTKPRIAGAGCNLQRHCNWEVFLGIGFKFFEFIQSIHRVLRFGQQHQVRIDIIYTEAERGVKKILERKWQQHIKLVSQMTNVIQEFGLSGAAMAQALTRKLGVERVEITGKNYRLINNDAVKEAARLEANSVGLILTSIPFSTQYEYSPNYADFGHSEGNGEFFEQMDYLTPELLRALQPGRLAAIHVKDRIVPGGMTGLGFQTVYPFHCRTIEHFTKHGFAYLGMKTIVTDVVRENNQTYRLGWSEQCKDGSKMGVGMPEYLLIFRKPPTDLANSYGDTPVVKYKPLVMNEDGSIVPFGDGVPSGQKERRGIVKKSGYSRSRWQIDAHGFTRSSGDSHLLPEEVAKLPHSDIFKLFRKHSLNAVYDFEHHVAVGEELENKGKLPVTFMLLQPQSWHDDVWTDITRMLTLNGSQWSNKKQLHLCPMQLDLGRRAIAQWSMAGETVLDPFSGLGTVPMLAVEAGRKGIGFELNHSYFLDSASYCKAAEEKIGMPTLFDLMDKEEEIVPEEALAEAEALQEAV